MTTRRFLVAVAVVAGVLVSAGLSPLRSQPLQQSAALWGDWRDRFVASNGRVIDNANGNISHSEGQGYGLLLAYLAGDRAAFHRIWAFTRTQLFVREDGLAAWRWDPEETPHLTDINNASDGDILIAYALALAAGAWGEERLLEDARRIAVALGTAAVVESDGRALLLPAVEGFSASARPDGPVVNLSYWIFEAFPILAELDPDTDWQAVADAGLALIDDAAFGPAGLPPEWLALGTSAPRPAIGFDAVFGYNAIRIPLYLMRSGQATVDRAEPFLGNRAADGAGAVVLLATGAQIEPLSDQGYRMVLGALDCVVNGVPLAADLKAFELDRYYPATLYLLSWFYLAEERPECL